MKEPKELLVYHYVDEKPTFRLVKYSRVGYVYGRKVVVVNKRFGVFERYSSKYKLEHGVYDYKTGRLICITPIIGEFVECTINYIGKRVDEYHSILGNKININEEPLRSRFIAMKMLRLDNLLIDELKKLYPKTI